MASLIKCVVRRSQVTLIASRPISSSCIVRKDLVKDLYLREIKAYKSTPPAKDAHVGAVKNFSTPSAPQPPTLPADIAGELEAYDKVEPSGPELAAKAASGRTEGASSSSAKEFLEFLEADLPKADLHH